jgi:hypothetical protein
MIGFEVYVASFMSKNRTRPYVDVKQSRSIEENISKLMVPIVFVSRLED